MDSLSFRVAEHLLHPRWQPFERTVLQDVRLCLCSGIPLFKEKKKENVEIGMFCKKKR